MSAELKPDFDDKTKLVEKDDSGHQSTKIKLLKESGCKKQTRVSSGSSPSNEDNTKRGVQLYSSLSNSRLIGYNTASRHVFLQNVPNNRHWKQSGTPCLVWHQFVSKLVAQRTQLTLLRKLYNQGYYTAQFLYKLQQFLGLQNYVSHDVTFYQSYSLNGETCKLPKLNILCKQIVSLLNDLDSCSAESLSKSLDWSMNLSSFMSQWRTLYEQITFDLVQCITTTRQIILNEIRFCYLFANYRSRIYSMITYVIKYNDIVFHPVLAAAGGSEQVISLEDVIACNVDMAALYIARSYHHKIVSSHSKSVPLLQCKSKLSDVMSSVTKCQVCVKHGHFLHKYCTNKCGTFLDAMSLMIQGAGENRVMSRTDLCSSWHVEEQLSWKLLRALYHLTTSSVFYETPLSCGEKRFVTVHEQFCDQTRNKTRRRWDDNYTNVVYTCTQRGLPNSWTCAADIPDFECSVYKLDTSFYSLISCNLSKILKQTHLTTFINKDLQMLPSLIQVGKCDRGLNDSLTRHFNSLSHLALSDSGQSLEEIQLVLKFVKHLNRVLQRLYSDFTRVLSQSVFGKEYSMLFLHITLLFELSVYLESLYKQLLVDGELQVPTFVSQSLTDTLDATKSLVQLFKDLPDIALDDLRQSLSSRTRDMMLDSTWSPSYWRKDVYAPALSPCIVPLADMVRDVSALCANVPEPYLTRIHHVLANNAAQTLTKHVINNKKITFSSKGVAKLESDVGHIMEVLKSCPVSSDIVLSTPDVLALRNDLNSLILKRRKSVTKPTCSCHKDQPKDGNWKRLSAPQLCTTCASTNLKPPALNRREIFSDSEVDADNAAQHLQLRQKRHLKERLEITM